MDGTPAILVVTGVVLYRCLSWCDGAGGAQSWLSPEPSAELQRPYRFLERLHEVRVPTAIDPSSPPAQGRRLHILRQRRLADLYPQKSHGNPERLSSFTWLHPTGKKTSAHLISGRFRWVPNHAGEEQ